MLITNYFSIDILKLNNELKNKHGGLLVLEDKFNGKSYTGRDLLPKTEDYILFDKIYSNADYIIFRKR